MRFIAPAREAMDASVVARPPLSEWVEFRDLLAAREWPAIAQLNRRIPGRGPRFVAQTPALQADGLHYERRIAERGEIATRERNWHDLLNALVWLRFPALKTALNRRQVAEIARLGSKQRSRAQCALTHFDEAGIIVALRDPALLDLWDAHDWHGLFWRRRQAWLREHATVVVFGHALLEHALNPGQLLVGKALVAVTDAGVAMDAVVAALTGRIAAGELLRDPQELRPLPLSGIPGWHAGNASESFYPTAPCFQPLRAGRRYPPAMRLSSGPS